jgi:hypothetical protein
MLSLLVVLTSAFGLSLVSAGSASAFNGSEWLGCRISPNTTSSYLNLCQSTSAQSYTVYFQVQAETSPSTYKWTLTSSLNGTLHCASGGTSSTNYCTLTDFVEAGTDQITATVILTQGTAKKTLTSWAELTCGGRTC